MSLTTFLNVGNSEKREKLERKKMWNDLGFFVILLTSLLFIIGPPTFVLFNTGSFFGATISCIPGFVGAIITFGVFGSMLEKQRRKVKEGIKKTLPPHEYDENVKFWEPLDRIDIGDSKEWYFVSFTDDGSLILSDKFTNVEKKDIEQNNYTEEDFRNIKEVKLQELDEYENRTFENRRDSVEKKKLILKSKASKYNEKLSELAELEREKLNELKRIHEEESELKKITRELEEATKSSNKVKTE